jgi:hypothetical protein
VWFSTCEKVSLVPIGGTTEAEVDLESQEESTPSYQLNLPDEILVALQESIQTAVETLTDKSETLLGFSDPCATLRTVYVYVASSTTGVGRNALQTLLSQVGKWWRCKYCDW